ncbi:MAG: 2-amino-4-hydroxy-6-hydroxymethyldihydropteridine diphosphokinase [Oscillospiraceae bacterium]|nr:2-amino-4-hydroxy-6-hydroxymethyldihydropteridine diphosphokinase [Oscillospiraceae bacterium]
MDKINIKNLEIFARHGVLPEENTINQKFLISASLYMDLSEAGRFDDLGKTLDYAKICGDIKKFIENSSFCLIETAAEKLAAILLNENPPLRRIWLEVKKPWAPITIPVETVSVEIERSKHTVYIALGSNIGDRKAHLDYAVSELGKAEGCRVVNVSSYISTKPYGYAEQDDFLNGCLELETLLTPIELLKLLLSIEEKSGRVRDIRWGPRTLDLDIVFYDDIVISGDTLRIPHAQAHMRHFVLTPLSEIAPYFLHPVLRKTVAELLDELEAK